MKRYIKALRINLDLHHGRLAKLKEWGKTSRQVLREPSKLPCPLVNLVIRELTPDHNGYLKIGVAVEEDWPTWDIVLPSLGYQVLKIYALEIFRNFLQGGRLSADEWLPPNQARRLNNLQDSCFFGLWKSSFVRNLWGGGINRYRTSVLMSVGSRVRNFTRRNGSWRLMHHHWVGGSDYHFSAGRDRVCLW